MTDSGDETEGWSLIERPAAPERGNGWQKVGSRPPLAVVDGDVPAATKVADLAADDWRRPSQAEPAAERETPAVVQPRPDVLRRLMIRLSRELGRPAGAADILSAAPGAGSPMTLDGFRLAAERLGFGLAEARLDEARLPRLAPPFIVCDPARPETARAVIRREGTAYVVYDPVADRSASLDAAAVAALGQTVLSLKAPDRVAPVKRGWRSGVVRRMRGVLTELAAASLMINLFALAAPLFIMTVFNKVVGSGGAAEATLFALAVGMAVIYAFDLVLRVVRVYISSHSGARVEALIGGELVHHLLRLPYRHFETTASGVIAERMRQLDTIRAFFTGQMPLIIADLAFAFVFLAALLFIEPLIALIVALAIPVFIVLSLLSHGRRKRLTEENFLGQAAKTSALYETMANALTVKSLGLESEIERRWDHRLGLSAWTGFRSNALAGLLSAVGQNLQQLLGLIVIVVGAMLIMDGRMSIGALIAANILASRAVAPMRQVVAAFHQVQEVRAAFRRIDEIMAEPGEAEAGMRGPGSPFVGRVGFENLSFRYADDLPFVLNSVSLTIEAGEIFGIVGPSGQGKTTLAKLIQGLYAPQHGRVLIDDTDIQHLSPAMLRRQIGIVPQEVQLFAGTVRENIAIGIDDKDPARVESVAKFVGAHDFIQRLPLGYDTVLSERGGGLSAGQRQLIAVARALIRNPRILIFDEATSALDPGSEERLIRALARARRGRTIILISHRMAPMGIADRVALLLDGQIERVGPPQEVVDFARGRMRDAAMNGGREG